jgi:hypothetical protein
MTVERTMRKSANISIRTDPALKEALEFCALEDNRSLASLVEKIFEGLGDRTRMVSAKKVAHL